MASSTLDWVDWSHPPFTHTVPGEPTTITITPRSNAPRRRASVSDLFDGPPEVGISRLDGTWRGGRTDAVWIGDSNRFLNWDVFDVHGQQTLAWGFRHGR